MHLYNLVLIPLLLIVLLMIWLVTTHSGLQTLFSLVNRVAPVTIEHQGLQGRLADFSAAELIVDLESTTIRVDALQLRWNPSALLAKELQLAELQAKKVTIALAQQPSQTPGEPFDIDTIELPLELYISDVGIDVIDLNGQELARNVKLRAMVTHDNWQVPAMSAETPYGSVRLEAHVEPQENWQHTIDVDGLHEQYGAVTARIVGNRDVTDGSLSAAAFEATSNLSVTAPLGDARWQLTAKAANLSALGRTGRIEIGGDGSWEEGVLTLDAVIDGIEAQIPRLAFQRVNDAVDVAMDGRVQEVPLAFSGRINPAELVNGLLRFDEVQVAPDLSLHGAQLQANGRWDELTFDLQARGKFHHPVTLKMQGTLLDYRQLTLASMNAQLLSGTVTGSGSLSLADSGPKADLSLRFSGLNFVGVDPRLPSAVSGRSRLQLDANTVRGSVSDMVAAIPGSDTAVRGSGGFTLTGRELSAARLALNAGSANQLNVKFADNRRDFDVSMEIQSLAAFIADARGEMRGQVTINPQDLSLQGTMVIADVDIPDVLSLSTADIEGSGAQSGSVVRINGTGLSAGAQQVESFNMSLTGTAAAHQITGAAQLANGQQLDVGIDGRLGDRDWQFTVTNLQLDYDGLSAQLESPASGQLSADNRTLEPLCLSVAGSGKACASLQQTPDVLTATATVSLPPGQTGLESWFLQFNLPALRIDQGLEMQFDMRQENGVIDSLALSGEVPQLVIPALDGESVEMTGINLSASGTAEAITYTTSLQLAGGSIASSGELVNIRQPRLNGDLIIDLPDLPALSALVSNLDIRRGAVAGDLRLQGPLSGPRLIGSLDLVDLQLEWPTLGTRHDGTLSFVFTESDDGVVAGELRSPSGVVDVTGTIAWTPAPAANFRLTGENFLIADTADLSVAASPDLTMRWEPGKYSLTGKIMIDRAYSSLDMPALQQSVQLSDDVVFVDDMDAMSQGGANQVTVDVVAEFKTPGKIDGRGITGEVDGRVRISQQPNRPALANGSLNLTGSYRAFGQVLNIENGQLVYTNTSLEDPVISAYATRSIDDITVGVRIDGRVSSLATRLESTPSMPESDILHYLVLGRAPGTATQSETNQLSAAALSLALKQSEAGVQSLGDRIGVTNLGITQELGMLALAVGKQISPRLYVSYTVGLLEPVDIARMRYSLNRFLFLEAEVADESRAGIHYRIEKD
ncbi:MAG: hypothetical protein HKN70_01045 [Gammaproteobacteria bacterium]|nr:hypothetical protein [Gammaproteobacteria bacterium]